MTTIDTNKIQEDIESILTHSQSYSFDLNAKNLISKWQKAKQPFIELFGGETIVRSALPVKIELSEYRRRQRFEDFISTLRNNEILTEDFLSFLKNNETGFFENKVLVPYPSFDISLGSKLSKSFRHFISDEATIRWAQDTASKYIQENKIEGYLYLSVDPRDFLTLSENNENWWSCQTLDGDYRSGNLSYMVDNTTIIAYLASSRQQHLKCFPKNILWNSKKWRMLIHTDMKSCAYFNRPYPYESEDLLSEVNKLLHEFNILNSLFSNPQDVGFRVVKTQRSQEMLFCNQLVAEGRVFDTRDIIDQSDYLGYCDIISSNCYSPIVAINIGKMEDYIYNYCSLDSKRKTNKHEEYEEFKKIFGIKIGEKIPCPCCGEEHLSRDNSLLCEICIADKDADEDFYVSCDSCFHHIYEDEECYWINDVPYCEKCYKAMQQEDKNIF